MINLAQVSGGKDSVAMTLWLTEQAIEFTPVFEDTGWEHPLTYEYLDYLDRVVYDGRLVRLKTDKYDSIADLIIKRHKVPGVRSRFCTHEMKIFPIHKYIEAIDDEVTSFIGVRADESAARGRLSETEWCDAAGGYWIRRPILARSAVWCFDILRRHGIKPNPLYLMGAGRVGCWPCVFVNLRELRALLRFTPSIKGRLRELEARMAGTENTFFRSGYIPERFCSRTYIKRWTDEETGKEHERVIGVPTVDDVFRYLESVDERQLPLIEAPKCMSIYNLCE